MVKEHPLSSPDEMQPKFVHFGAQSLCSRYRVLRLFGSAAAREQRKTSSALQPPGPLMFTSGTAAIPKA